MQQDSSSGKHPLLDYHERVDARADYLLLNFARFIVAKYLFILVLSESIVGLSNIGTVVVSSLSFNFISKKCRTE